MPSKNMGLKGNMTFHFLFFKAALVAPHLYIYIILYFQGVDSRLGCTSWSRGAVLFWRWSKVSLSSSKDPEFYIWMLSSGILNSVYYIFSPSVLYFSWHRYEHQEFWPQLRESDYDSVGKEKGAGFNINVPWNKVSNHTDTAHLKLL